MSSHKAYNPLRLTSELYQYMLDLSLRESEPLHSLRVATESHPRAIMQGAPDQVQLMCLILNLMGAKRGIEVGIFTGYTTLAFAQVVGADGKVVALDISDEYASIGKPFWQQAGVHDRIQLVIQPASQTLRELLDNGEAGTYDFGFIDADKTGYAHSLSHTVHKQPSNRPNDAFGSHGRYHEYYELLLQLLRPGGVIFVDNVLWHGSVIDATQTDPDTVALRELNLHLKADKRIELAYAPIGDGVAFARKL
jgi:predicted O-methyltransferase YrrM